MRCKRCGTVNPDDTGRCVGCGARLAIPAPPPESDASVPQQGPDIVGKIIPYRNPSALAAYYMGVFSLIPCLGGLLALLAIVFGILGLRYARGLPGTPGKVHAWVGIIIGTLVLLIYLVFIIFGGAASF